MPSATSPNHRVGSAPPDDLDQYLDFDNAVEDFLRDIPVNNSNETNATTTEQPRDEDQEVQIKKKRRPVPKLDENLLLSQHGIPKLRRIAKTRLKFRGKGHEFTDVSRLLNTYQLWLDDLYPRAKFRDALTMVEKVGHSKRMQVMRRAWLDETKPFRRDASPELEMSGANGSGEEVEEQTHDAGKQHEETASTDLHGGRMGDRSDQQPRWSPDAPDEDELDALMSESRQVQRPQQKQRGPFIEDEPDEDELDALLREDDTAGLEQRKKDPPSRTDPEDDSEQDELDGLMAEQDTAFALKKQPAKQSSPQRDEHMLDDFADDEEAMAAMGWE